jgi:hypothetical protein
VVISNGESFRYLTNNKLFVKEKNANYSQVQNGLRFDDKKRGVVACKIKL